MKLFISPNHQLHATDAYPLYGNHPVLELPSRIDLIRVGFGRVIQTETDRVSDYGPSTIERVHSPNFISFVREAFAREQSSEPAPWVRIEDLRPRVVRYESSHFEAQKQLYLTDTFTQILANTFEAAYWAAQTVVSAADSITHEAKAAYALIRPPGHHAYTDQAGGFCFFNNAAIATRQLQTRGYQRVCILDVDFHHGNGTQEIFYYDPTVLFCSLHGHPDFAYPYFSGMETERGLEEGEGTTINEPLKKGANDCEYLGALEKVMVEIQNYRPDALVVSLGFDAALGDPYGGFAITPAGFRQIGASVKALQLPTLLVQEGGYLLERLADNSEAFFKGFCG